MSSWPFMAFHEIRKRHLNDRINATILKSIKNVIYKEEQGIIQIKPTDDKQKLNTACFLYPRMCQLTSLSSKKYKNIMNGFKTQDNEFWRHYLRFNKVISTAENVLILNIIQVEGNASAFNTIFGIDIDGVNCFK